MNPHEIVACRECGEQTTAIDPVCSLCQADEGLIPRTEPIATKEEIKARIELLADEMDANDEENDMMQAECDILYAKLDAMEKKK